jgi:hypothetical protein
MGDYTPLLSASSLSIAGLLIPPLGTATNTNNYGTSNTNNGLQVSTWNGSAAQTSTGFNWMSVGTGTNPAIEEEWQIYPCVSSCVFYFANPLNVNGTIGANHFGAAASSGISIAAGAGAGTSPTVAIVGYSSDISGWFTVTTGSTPTASVIVATLTFGTTYTFPGPKCIIAPANAATAALAGTATVNVFPADTTSTTISPRVGSTALAASTAYEWSYMCTN